MIVPPRSVESLARALESEAALAASLAETLVRQRDAVAACDPAAVEQTVNELTRVLTALDDGRTARRTLLQSLVGDAEASLDAVVADAAKSAPRLAAARRALEQALRGAAREAALQQVVLRRALDRGEASLLELFSALREDAGTYAPPHAHAEAAVAGVLVDRTA